MFFSTNLPISNSNTITNFASLTSKSSIFQAPTIHSTKTRNGIFADGTNYGKLHGSSLRRTSSNQRTLPPQIYQERAERPLTAQNWRKNLSVNINEKELETGLRDYLGISQPFRPKTSTSKENTSIFQQRVGTSSSNKRGTLGISSVKSVKSILHIPSTFEVDGMLRRDLMCQTEEVDMNDFIDEKAQEKFQYIRFIKAPLKEFLKLLKLSNYDVTLVPSDSRRVVIEAILREFFLNLIPENSDYLICKNTQNQIYTILFTGRLVPICKACSSVTRFEISSDLGFQVLCNSQYCNIKVLYQTKLNEKTRECLWPSNIRPDVEHSLPIRDAKRKPMISKLIQSGKYKNTDFSKVISNIHTPDLPQTRPNTTANVMRKVGSASTINRKIIKTSFTEKTSHLEGNQRPNTVQGLRRLGSRPDTAGSMSGSLDNKDFKGASILKEFDDKGLFAREIEEIGVIEQVSEEMSGEEEEEKENVPKKILEEMRQKEMRRPIPAAKKPVQKKKNDRLTEKLEGYAIPRLSDHKNLFVGNKSSSKLDNSLEEIHNMVNILSK